MRRFIVIVQAIFKLAPLEVSAYRGVSSIDETYPKSFSYHVESKPFVA